MFSQATAPEFASVQDPNPDWFAGAYANHGAYLGAVAAHDTLVMDLPVDPDDTGFLSHVSVAQNLAAGLSGDQTYSHLLSGEANERLVRGVLGGPDVNVQSLRRVAEHIAHVQLISNLDPARQIDVMNSDPSARASFAANLQAAMRTRHQAFQVGEIETRQFSAPEIDNVPLTSAFSIAHRTPNSPRPAESDVIVGVPVHRTEIQRPTVSSNGSVHAAPGDTLRPDHPSPQAETGRPGVGRHRRERNHSSFMGHLQSVARAVRFAIRFAVT